MVAGRICTNSWAFAVILTQLFASTAGASEWPDRPVRIVAPFAVGGTADLLGRMVAERLSQMFGEQFFVENRGGGAGAVGTAIVASAAPDGYTFLIPGTSNVIAPVYYDGTTPDNIETFTHVAYLGGAPVALLVHPSLGISTFKEFMTWAKQQTKPIDFMSAGVASNGFLFGLEFARREGLRFNHIPYKGSGAGLLDLVAGHVKVATMSLSTAAEQVRGKGLIALAVSTNERLGAFPGVPTFEEVGYRTTPSGSWFTLAGPPGLNRSIVDKLNLAVVRILKDPKIREQLDSNAFETKAMTPDELMAFVRDERSRWAPLARSIAAQEK